MSYNISSMKVSKISLVLPLRFNFQEWLEDQPSHDKRGYEKAGRRWCLEDSIVLWANLGEGTWKLSLMEGGQTISGIIEGDSLVTTALEDWSSDGSGHLYSDILIPLFEAFQGTLEAIVVWERGDSVKRLAIHDGIVEETEIA